MKKIPKHIQLDDQARTPESMGTLPAGWHWSKMGDIADIVGGGTPKTEIPEYWGGDIPWVTPADLSGYAAKMIDRGRRSITTAGLHNSGARLLPSGTVLFSSRAPIGYVAIASNPVCTNQGFKNFVLRQGLLPDFVYYWLQSAKQIAVSLASGTTFLEISGKKAAEIPVPIAPLETQRKIVTEIEIQFSRLDAGVAALRRVQANLKRYRASVLKAACEGRLVETEAEVARKDGRAYESGEQLLQRILAERRRKWSEKGKYKEPPPPDVVDLRTLPEGWTIGTVEQLASPEPNSITDGPFGSNLKTEHYMESGPRVIRLQNIGDAIYLDAEAHISQEHFERLQKHRVFADDIVIAGFGENPPRSCILPASLGPAIVKADCIRFKPTTSLNTRYLNAVLNSEPVRKQTKGMVHGVGRPRLNLGEIKSIVLPLPPLVEQIRIVAELERRLSVADELQATVDANLRRAVRMRQAVLKRVFRQERLNKFELAK